LGVESIIVLLERGEQHGVMLQKEPMTTDWRVVLMQGREERVAEGSWRRKALFRFVGSLA
jgi:hypothetical protein